MCFYTCLMGLGSWGGLCSKQHYNIFKWIWCALVWLYEYHIVVVAVGLLSPQIRYLQLGGRVRMIYLKPSDVISVVIWKCVVSIYLMGLRYLRWFEGVWSIQHYFQVDVNVHLFGLYEDDIPVWWVHGGYHFHRSGVSSWKTDLQRKCPFYDLWFRLMDLENDLIVQRP